MTEKKYLKSKDYYKIFLKHESGELQVTSLENRICNCVNTTDYKNNIFIRLYSCWERAFEYIYRASIKNYGHDMVRDLIKAKTECETINQLLEENNLLDRNLFEIVPENVLVGLKTNSLFDRKNWDQFHNTFGYKNCSLLYPLVLSYLIDFKKRFEYIQEQYNFRISSIIEQEIEELTKTFLSCNNYVEFLGFIKTLDVVIYVYTHQMITVEFNKNDDRLTVIKNSFKESFGDLFELELSEIPGADNGIIINIRKFQDETIFKSFRINTNDKTITLPFSFC